MKKNKLIQIGKKVVELEISALKKLKNSLNKSFEKAVFAISIVREKNLGGVGKSYLIGKKINDTIISRLSSLV